MIMMVNSNLLEKITIIYFFLISPVSLTELVEFPVKEFFGFADADFSYQRFIQENYLCFDPRKTTHNGCCSCDMDCIQHHTCCADLFWKDWTSRNVSQYRDFLEMLHKSDNKRPVCQRLLPDVITKGYGTKNVFLVDTCPSFVDEEDHRLCTQQSNDLTSLVPVAGSDGFAYKNIYCAKCHDVANFTMGTMFLQCHDESPRNDLCEISLASFNYYPCTIFKKECNRENEYFHLCNSFITPFNGYANLFCYLCNHERPLYYKFDRLTDVSCVSWPKSMPFSWSSLLSFSDPLEERSHDASCDDNTDILEDFIVKCPIFNCPLGYYAKNKICINEAQNPLPSEFFEFEDCFSLQNITLNLSNVTNATNIIRIFDGVREYGKNGYYSLFLHPNSILLSDKFHLLSEISMNLNMDEQVHLYFDDKDFLYCYNLNMSLSNQNNGIINCSNHRIIHQEEVKFNDKCEAYVNHTVYPKWQTFMSIDIGNFHLEEYLHVCESFVDKKGCPLYILNTNVTLQKDGSIVIIGENKTEQTYNRNQVIIIDNNLYGICMDVIVENAIESWYLTIRLIEGYLSVIGTSCSLISYIALLYFYHKKVESYKVHTLCIFALCVSLSFGDGIYLALNIVYLIGFQPVLYVCDIIGSIDRFFLISAQMWCLVLAFDSAKTIRSFSNVTIAAFNRFIKYSCFVYLTSLIVLITAIVLRENDILDKTYERRDSCFFDVGPTMRIIVYVLPLSLSFAISLSFVTSSLLYITRERKKNKHVLGSIPQIDLFKIALKLVIMTGVPEGIGLIHIPNAAMESGGIYVNLIFGLLYSITKGFRGVILYIMSC